MKKFTALLLAVCMIASVSAAAFADNGCEECVNLSMSNECSDYSATKHMVINRTGTIADSENGAEIVYDTNGNILTLTDEDGVVWEYVYSANGNYKYRIGTIANPGWSVSAPQKYTNNYISPAAVFDVPIENCIGFDVSYEINEMENAFYKEWSTIVYVDEPEASDRIYQEEGRFRSELNEEVYFTVELSKPTTVYAVCPRPVFDIPVDFTASIGIYNVRIKSYEY